MPGSQNLYSVLPMKNVYRFVLILGIAIGISPTAKAQLAYSLKTTVGTSLSEYIPLTNGAPIFIDWTNVLLYPPDGEDRTIQLFNKPFMLMDSNRLYVAGTGNIDVFSETEGVIVDVFNGDLDSLMPSAVVRYTREQEAGEDVLKIEWKDISIKGCPESRINCQLWLYETTGIIEMHYGTIVMTCDSVFNGPYIGLFKGNRNFTANLKLNWLKGDPAAPTLTTANFYALKGAPSFGTVYRLTPTSLNDVEPPAGQTSLRFYPNPANDKLTIQIPTAEQDAVIRITDITGKALLQLQSAKPITTIDVGHLPKGMYIIELNNGYEIKHQRFIRE